MQGIFGKMIIRRQSSLLLILMALLLTISACSGKPRPPKFKTEYRHSSLTDNEISEAKLLCKMRAQDEAVSYMNQIPLKRCPSSQTVVLCRVNDNNRREEEKQLRYLDARAACLLSFGFEPVKVCVKRCR